MGLSETGPLVEAGERAQGCMINPLNANRGLFYGENDSVRSVQQLMKRTLVPGLLGDMWATSREILERKDLVDQTVVPIAGRNGVVAALQNELVVLIRIL